MGNKANRERKMRTHGLKSDTGESYQGGDRESQRTEKGKDMNCGATHKERRTKSKAKHQQQTRQQHEATQTNTSYKLTTTAEAVKQRKINRKWKPRQLKP